MQTLFKIDLSLGAACNALDRVSEACAPATAQLRQQVAQSDLLHVDETGWKSNGEKRWLWVFVFSFGVFFQLASSRGAKVLKSVLGESFTGILVTDDFSAYSAYHKKGLRQLCWAHLIRKLKGLKDTRSSPDASLFAKNLLREAGNLFAYWHAFKEMGFARSKLWTGTSLIRARMKRLCLHYTNSPDRAVRTRAQKLLQNWDHLFTFLRYEGVEPTNNTAERALRPPAQWRKICFGNHSEPGERFTQTILTVTRTCQMQGKNTFKFLTDLMAAYFRDQPLPSLL